MENLSRKSVGVFLLFLMVGVLQFETAVQQDEQVYPHPPIHKSLLDAFSLLKKTHKGSWDKVKTVIHDLQMRFTPPNLDFRAATDDQSEGMKEAAGKSFQQSKETVKGSAKSVAGIVGEAVHKTAQKAKTPSSKKESDSEL